MRRYLLILSFVLLVSCAATADAQNRVSRTRFSTTPRFSTRPPSTPQRGYGFDWYQGRPGTWTGNAMVRSYRPLFPLYETRSTSRNAARGGRRRGR